MKHFLTGLFPNTTLFMRNIHDVILFSQLTSLTLLLGQFFNQSFTLCTLVSRCSGFFYLSHTHIFCLEFGLKLIPPFFVAVSSLPREVTLYKRKVSMSRKVKKSNKANFSFGNDEIVMRSSYTYDFNSLRAVHPIRDRRLDVPKGAQVSIMTQEHMWLLSSNSNG